MSEGIQFNLLYSCGGRRRTDREMLGAENGEETLDPSGGLGPDEIWRLALRA